MVIISVTTKNRTKLIIIIQFDPPRQSTITINAYSIHYVNYLFYLFTIISNPQFNLHVTDFGNGPDVRLFGRKRTAPATSNKERGNVQNMIKAL